MPSIAIAIFPDVEELDFVGPWEVLTASSALLEKDGAPPDRVVLVAERLDPVRCRKGMRVLPDVSFADHPPLDVVVVPGGEGTLLGAENPVLLR